MQYDDDNNNDEDARPRLSAHVERFETLTTADASWTI
jgi:hypothetical protein